MRWPTSVRSASERALLVVGEDLGADRDLDDQVLAAGAGAVGAGAALAARGAEMLGVAEVDQRIEAGHRFEDDVAALAAVAAVGPAEFDELLPPEADRARAAGARADEDLGLVEEMHRGRELGDSKRRGEPRRISEAVEQPVDGVAGGLLLALALSSLACRSSAARMSSICCRSDARCR